MKVSVKFYAHLRDLVDRRDRFELELVSNATISDVLDELIRDTKIREHIFSIEKELKSDVTLLVNGREIKFLEGVKTILNSGDEISIFPMVAGG